MEKESSNPIAIQSKEWIIEALINLLKEKRYDDITITEIADKAQLARRTFYRNFDSKEAVLNSFIQNLVSEYVEDLSKAKSLEVFDIAKVYFTFWCRHLEFLRLMDKNDLLHIILKAYNDFLPIIHKKFKGENRFEENDILEYIIAFSGGGFWNMLIVWVKNGAKKTPVEMAELVDKIIGKSTFLE